MSESSVDGGEKRMGPDADGKQKGAGTQHGSGGGSVDRPGARAEARPAESAAGRALTVRLYSSAREAEYNALVDTILQGRVKTTAEGHLVLPEGMTWPIATNNVLFVRPCYAPLFESKMGMCLPQANSYRHRIVLTGQPGIGKSVFGWYLIYRLLTEKTIRRPIVYANGLLSIVVRIDAGSVRVHPVSEFTTVCHHYGKNEAVVIADSVIPAVLETPTVVIASPFCLMGERKEVFNFFSGQAYIPLPDEAEVLAMRAAAFPDLDEEKVRLRMQLWGPIPWSVLVRTSASCQKAMWDYIRGVRADDIDRLLTTTCSNVTCGDSRRLVHQQCGDQADCNDSGRIFFRGPYSLGPPRIASPFLAEWMVEHFARQGRWSLARRVCELSPIPSRRGPRVVRLDNAARVVLDRGGTFVLKDLDCRWHPTREIQLPNRATVARWSDRPPPCRDGERGYLWDARTEQYLPFTIALSDKHTIDQKKLRASLASRGVDVAALGDEGRVDFVWVVPEGINWRGFRTPTAGTEDDVVNRVLRHWVLELSDKQIMSTVTERLYCAQKGKSFAERLHDKILAAENPVKPRRARRAAGGGGGGGGGGAGAINDEEDKGEGGEGEGESESDDDDEEDDDEEDEDEEDEDEEEDAEEEDAEEDGGGRRVRCRLR